MIRFVIILTLLLLPSSIFASFAPCKVDTQFAQYIKVEDGKVSEGITFSIRESGCGKILPTVELRTVPGTDYVSTESVPDGVYLKDWTFGGIVTPVKIFPGDDSIYGTRISANPNTYDEYVNELQTRRLLLIGWYYALVAFLGIVALVCTLLIYKLPRLFQTTRIADTVLKRRIAGGAGVLGCLGVVFSTYLLFAVSYVLPFVPDSVETFIAYTLGYCTLLVPLYVVYMLVGTALVLIKRAKTANLDV